MTEIHRPKVAPKVTIEAKGDKAEVFIFDEIVSDDFFGGVSAKSFREQLESVGNVSEIVVHINSGGGDAFDGMSIYTSLVNHPAKISVEIESLAGSIASVIAMAGDTVRIAEQGMIFVHEAESFAFGRAEDLRATADLVDKVNDQQISVYRDKTGATEEKVRGWISAAIGTWFTAKESLEAKLVDEIANKRAIAAKVDPAVFAEIPDTLLCEKVGVCGCGDKPKASGNIVDGVPTEGIQISASEPNAGHVDTARARRIRDRRELQEVKE